MHVTRRKSNHDSVFNGFCAITSIHGLGDYYAAWKSAFACYLSGISTQNPPYNENNAGKCHFEYENCVNCPFSMNILAAKRACLAFVWIALTIAAFACVAYEITMIIIGFLDSPIMSTASFTANRTLVMPIVSVCPFQAKEMFRFTFKI